MIFIGAIVFILFVMWWSYQFRKEFKEEGIIKAIMQIVFWSIISTIVSILLISYFMK